MRYFVIAQDGSRYGPADTDMLQRWLAEGRISAQTTLEGEGSGQRLLASAVLSSLQPPVAASAPPPASASFGNAPVGGQVFVNTSGQGPSAVVPPEIRGWSWAAFLGGGIWSIAHSTSHGSVFLL